MDPMLIYVCCVRRFFLTLILLEVPIQYIYMYMTVIDIYIFIPVSGYVGMCPMHGIARNL
jgi:hypothetical protein